MLDISHLTVKYGKPGSPGERVALSDVSVRFAPGERVAVLGPSGAGKSTFIRCINVLVRPTKGEVIWNGQRLTRLSEKELQAVRTRIGMVFQQFQLVGRATALTNVLTGTLGARAAWKNAVGYFDSTERGKAIEALRSVGLAGYERHRAERLSGGQQQRVAIARMLMQQPTMILGDEPVASLDPITAAGIMDLIASVHKQGELLSIINLHSVELATSFATRIIGLNQGKLVYDGTPQGLTKEQLDRIYKQAN